MRNLGRRLSRNARALGPAGIEPVHNQSGKVFAERGGGRETRGFHADRVEKSRSVRSFTENEIADCRFMRPQSGKLGNHLCKRKPRPCPARAFLNLLDAPVRGGLVLLVGDVFGRRTDDYRPVNRR